MLLLLSSTQSGFKPKVSCDDQLISITHSIISAFDTDPLLEVRGVFLDLSKAFDRVWHEGLFYKLKNSRININFLDLTESFLHNRLQRGVLDGQSSNLLKMVFNKGLYQDPYFFSSYCKD